MKSTPYSKIIFTSKKLVLRPYKVSDYKLCQESHQERLTSQNKFDLPIQTSTIKSKKEFSQKIRTFKLNGKNGHQYVLGIFDPKTGKHIGEIGLFTINKQLSWLNLGFQIHNQYWSQGYASQAAKAALSIAFNSLHFHRVEAATEPTNKAAIAVVKKAGLLREGKRKKFFLHNGGLDMVVFANNAIDYLKKG